MDKTNLIGFIVSLLIGIALIYASILIWGMQWWLMPLLALPILLLILFGEWLHLWLEEINKQDRPPNR